MKVLAICSSLEPELIRLQPAVYLFEVCKHLARLGWQIRIVSDGYPRLAQREELEGLSVNRLRSIRFPPLIGNAQLQLIIETENPDIILWNIGPTSFYHLRPGKRIGKPIIGILGGSMYTFGDICQLGAKELVTNPGFVLLNLLGSIVPKILVANFMKMGPFISLVSMDNLTKERLIHLGIPDNKIVVIPPGVDSDLFEFNISIREAVGIRNSLGVNSEDFLVLYFGSPEPYRGIGDLVKAIGLSRKTLPNIKLLILSRRHNSSAFGKMEEHIQKLSRKAGTDDLVIMKSGFLTKAQILDFVGAADVVALPFRLVAAGVPISILEAVALGKPVISARVDGISELLNQQGYLVNPRDVEDLACALVKAASEKGSSEDREKRRCNVPRWSEVGDRVAAIVKAAIKVSGDL